MNKKYNLLLLTIFLFIFKLDDDDIDSDGDEILEDFGDGDKDCTGVELLELLVLL
jgi:hypothetical protein